MQDHDNNRLTLAWTHYADLRSPDAKVDVPTITCFIAMMGLSRGRQEAFDARAYEFNNWSYYAQLKPEGLRVLESAIAQGRRHDLPQILYPELDLSEVPVSELSLEERQELARIPAPRQGILVRASTVSIVREGKHRFHVYAMKDPGGIALPIEPLSGSFRTYRFGEQAFSPLDKDGAVILNLFGLEDRPSPEQDLRDAECVARLMHDTALAQAIGKPGLLDGDGRCWKRTKDGRRFQHKVHADTRRANRGEISKSRNSSSATPAA